MHLTNSTGGHEWEWTGPGTEMLARGVKDCHGSVWSNAVGETLSGEGPEADKLNLR